MSRLKPTPRVPQVAPPPYVLSDDLLDSVLATLPPLAEAAPPAWHLMRRARIAREIAAWQPGDAAQARLAGQIITLRCVAVHTMGLASRPGTTPEQARRVERVADGLARMARQLERALRRRQKLGVRPGGAVAWEGVDLLALVAAWDRNAVQIEGVAAEPSPSPLGGSTSPAARERCTGVPGTGA
jgi:hypothetical protein